MIPVEKLQMELLRQRGVRVGQTAVVSRKVHSIYPNCPEVVHVVVNSDAGRVFYNRFQENEIVHIDLFHQIAVCDVKKLALFLKKHIELSPLSYLVDYIDIQTGGGGGRLSGSLDYGLSESLKKDHLNHVHLAILLPDDELAFIFFLIDNVEKALREQKIELRKIEKIVHEFGNTPMDMSPYSADFDSYLKQNAAKYNEERMAREAVELLDKFGSLSEIKEILDTIVKEASSAGGVCNLQRKYADLVDIISYMERKQFLNKRQNRYRLTRDGEKLHEYINLNYKQLESILKKSIKRLPRLNNDTGLNIAYTAKKEKQIKRGRTVRENYDSTDWIEELDVVETVKNSLVRCYHEKEAFSINKCDLVTVKHYPKINQDVCLIIDASASMAGYRLRNAKFLAKHLILKSHRRVSVLAFQEKDVKVFVPFTKNFDTLEKGLNDIISTGLTPLALAIDRGLSYLSSRHLKNPLIILITDGIPTVSLWTADPVQDAINAATRISRKNINFCCIGLQPNRDCLVKITQAAKGKLFIVDELNREALLDAARKSGQLL
ncbi:vWA domain-containing protein [Thermoanaerobacterium sp. DL9XJH110]|uniref:vWA domain-containing protein n=1 Tax=Thermoanaerobacterium sp. DL9XJH110 TaxID=3386643 RepID=UPI003BB5891B